MTGGALDDWIDGGSDNDTLLGSLGDDFLLGAGGNDTFDFQAKGFAGFVGGTFQTINGGSQTGIVSHINKGIDLIKFPGAPGDYFFRTEFDSTTPSWSKTKTIVTYKAAPSTFYSFETSDIEKVVFKSAVNNPVALSSGNVAVEMLTLAGEVYGRLPTLEHNAEPLAYEKGYDNAHLVSTSAAKRGWHPVSAMELGIKPADFGQQGTLKYSFVDGFYAARDIATQDLIGEKVGDLSEANAMVLTGMVGAKKTLAVVFRGTDQFADFDDYADFSQHYAKFKPLVDGIKAYLGENNIDQVLVSGHSLGAGMVEHFLADFPGNQRFQAFTAGSPGGNTGKVDPRVTNFVHTDDPVTWVSDFSQKQLKVFGTAVASLISPADPVFAAKLIAYLEPLEGKNRSGSNINLDSSVKYSLWELSPIKLEGTLFDEHSHALYTRDLIKLLEFAADSNSPFAGTVFAEKLLHGVVYNGPALQIGLGKPVSPGSASSKYDPLIKAPLADDDYVLGNNGQDDRFVLTKKTLVQEGKRVFDGGTGDGDRVVLPFGQKRLDDGNVFKVFTNSDGSKTLKYDAEDRPGVDHWEKVGTFYRTEEIVFGSGGVKNLSAMGKLADIDLFS